MNNTYKKIANSFIQNAIVGSNANTLKLVWYIVANIKDHDYSQLLNTHTFDEKEISEKINVSIPTIRKNLKNIQKTTISFEDSERYQYEDVSLIPRVAPLYNGKIEIDLYTTIVKQFTMVDKNYTFLNVSNLYKLKNKHSIRLLPLLNTINGYTSPVAKEKAFNLQDLNELFGTKYKTFAMIAQEVLTNIKRELDHKSELSFKYQTIKKNSSGLGRPKTTAIKIIPIKTEQKTELFHMEHSQTLDDIKKDGYIDMKNHPLILKEIEKILPEHEYITEMRIFIDYCISNNKEYNNFPTRFLKHLQGRK